MAGPHRYPFHETVQEFIPGFDYKNVAPEVRARFDMRRPDNITGHQQRAVSVWWAIQQCGPLDLGIDFGSPKGLTPYCVHVDKYGTGGSHPFYGGTSYFADVAADASSCDFFPDGGVPLVVSSHSLEHMPREMFGAATSDEGVSLLLCGWVAKLRRGGVLVMVVPDNDHFDVMGSDADHRHAWGAKDFRGRVLDRVLAEMPVELVDYDTLDNHFSFDVVLRKHG